MPANKGRSKNQPVDNLLITCGKTVRGVSKPRGMTRKLIRIRYLVETRRPHRVWECPGFQMTLGSQWRLERYCDTLEEAQRFSTSPKPWYPEAFESRVVMALFYEVTGSPKARRKPDHVSELTRRNRQG